VIGCDGGCSVEFMVGLKGTGIVVLVVSARLLLVLNWDLI
jgi:hypothetical protein